MTTLIDSEKKRAVKKAFHTLEGKLFTTALFLVCASAALIVMISFIYKDISVKLLSMIATHLLSGRAGGISVGLNAQLPDWAVIITATTIDSLVVLLLYPLFVLSCRRYFRPKLLKNVLDRSMNAAEKNKSKIRKYGAVGLFFFVWFPLHMTGPLVGSIIGFMLGLNTLINLAIVITGTFLAVLSWVYVLRNLITAAGRYSFIIPITVIVIAAVLLAVLKLKKPETDRQGQKSEPPRQ